MLELKNISFTVGEEKDEKTIIRDLSLTIDNGKFVVRTERQRKIDPCAYNNGNREAERGKNHL